MWMSGAVLYDSGLYGDAEWSGVGGLVLSNHSGALDLMLINYYICRA